MPITKQALKKLRHDKIRSKQTEKIRASLRRVVKTARVSPSKKTLTDVFSALDKAVKQHVIHKNKSARLKSRLSKLLSK